MYKLGQGEIHIKTCPKSAQNASANVQQRKKSALYKNKTGREKEPQVGILLTVKPTSSLGPQLDPFGDDARGVPATKGDS